MLHPVGKLPPALYWRRRLIFVVLPALLILLMIVYVFSGDGGSSKKAVGSVAASSATPAATGQTATSPTTRSSTTQSSTTQSGTTQSSTAQSSSAPSGSATTAQRSCTAADLRIQAASGKPSYAVNSSPDLYLVVTDISTTPCRQDLADKQIELRIFTGDVRVWGSHDCVTEPGVSVVTLKPGAPVRRGIIWSGQTAAPDCPDNRLVAQAGTYSLVALLAGKTSVPVTFALT